jgi:monoamine oxidase
MRRATQANAAAAHRRGVAMAGPMWSRRQFLRAGAVGGAAAATTLSGLSTPARALAALGGDTPRVAVIGAGLAGLTAAWKLKGAGISATVYEARDRVGGRAWSETGADGLVYDLGGSFINTDHADMLALVDELGLELFNRNREAARTGLPGTAYYFDRTDYDEATVAGALRAIQKRINADANKLFGNYEKFSEEFDALSAADYLDRHADKIDDAYARTLLENAIRTEYGAEPHESSALQLLFLTPSVTGKAVDVLGYSDEEFVVEGGVGQIATRLADRMSNQIELGQVLTKITDKGQGFRLFTDQGVQADYDFVIVTVPATVLGTIEFKDVSSLPPLFREYLQTVALGHNEKLFAGFDDRAWRTSGEFAADAWTDLGFSSVWDGTQRQIDRPDAALTFFYGGDEVDAMPRVENGSEAVSALGAFVPGLVDAANGSYRRTDWTNDPFSLGAYVNFEPGQLTRWARYFWIEASSPNFRQDVAFGNLLFAGEHTSDEWYGFMNGGAQTGRLAAAKVLERITA